MATVRDIMASDVITISTEAPVRELVDLLEREEITGVPVIDADEPLESVAPAQALAGVVSTRDVLRLAREMAEVPEAVKWGLGAAMPRGDGGFLTEPPLGGEFFAYFVTDDGEHIDVSDRIRTLPADLFEGYRVADIMTPAPYTVPPSADVGELARHLLQWKVHRALVVEAGRLEGIVTTTDVLKVLAAK